MTSQGPKSGGEEAKSKQHRIECFYNSSDDESEEMMRIREKLQRRRHHVKEDDDTVSSQDETSVVAAEEPSPWNEDDDDDAFDAKLAAMNVFPPVIKAAQPERRPEGKDTFFESGPSHPINCNDMLAGMPSSKHANPNELPDPQVAKDHFSDDDDLIAAIEYPESPWNKSHDTHFGEEDMNTTPFADPLTQEGNRRDNSNQDSIQSVVEPSFLRHSSTETSKDTVASDSNNLHHSKQMVQTPTSGSHRDHKRYATASGIPTKPRNIPPLLNQQKAEQPALTKNGNDKENIYPGSGCIYEYASEHNDWNEEDDWIIHDSDEDVESTPIATNRADPFGFDITDLVPRSNSGDTRLHNEASAKEPNQFTDAFSVRKETVLVDGAENEKYAEQFLHDAFGFSDEIPAIPTKSSIGQDGSTNQLGVDPFATSETMDEKSPEVDPSLYAPQPIDAIQEPIIHHLSPRNRPIQSRRKIPITQVFQGPVAALWKNKFNVFNHVQSEIANMLAYSDDNVIVSAPTGAGKTAVFEMAMARFFEVDIQATPPGFSDKMMISKRRKIVYMSPSKALCEERYADWSKRLSALNLGIEIAVVTGDGDPSDSYHDLASSHFIITTPEKWDSLTRRWTEKFFLFASVKLFLVDEVHLIGDKSRGCCLEAVICRMKTIQRAASQITVSQADINMSSYASTSPDAINTLLRFVAVSATLPNIADIAMFFEANEAYIFDESYRPVPLTIHVIGQGKLGADTGNGQFLFWKNLDRNIPELIFRFSNRRPTIVFCHSKADCEKLADFLATTQNIGRRDEATSGMASRTRVSKLQRVLLQGIAYHHAGLEVEDRRLIEESFTQGKIRVLCATSTIAMGVNLPAHLVIIKGTSAYRGSGEGGGYQDIDQASLLQMIGRAGRPGFDTTGTAVIMTDNDSKTRFEQLASSGLSPAMSQLKGLKLVETINTEVSQKVICSMTNAINWIKGTLYFLQLSQDPEGHGVKVVSNYSIDTHLHNLCRNAMDRLCAIGTITATESQDIYPLPASHIMSQRLVDYEAMEQISTMPFDVSHNLAITTISKIEGMHCPVRRNEKKALNAAHKSLKMYKLEGPLSKARVQEPWQKSFVLLQAYIEDLEFEDHDFTMKKEMSAMVEYAARILTAVEEFSIKGTKNGNVAFQCMRIRRSLAVRLWSAKDGMLQQIKGIGKTMAFSLHMNGISSFEDVVKSSEVQLEKAVSRPHPFGRELRNACASILQSRLKILAELDRTHHSTILRCTLQRTCETNNEDNDSFEKPSTVTYTLLAYTDRAGGLFLAKQNIIGPGTYQAAIPQSDGHITIQLVASLVGLDDTLELGDEISKTSVQNNQKTEDLGEHVRTRIRNAKPNNAPARSAKQEFRAPITGKKTYNSVTKETNSQIPLPRQFIDREHRRISVVPENTTVTPSPKLTPFHSFEKSSVTAVVEREPRIHSNPSTHNPRNDMTVNQDRSPAFHSSNKGTLPKSSIKRKLESTYTQINDKFSNDNASWRRMKNQQQKSQQRAFVRQSDNPFKNFKHDPNDSESYLDRLSYQGKLETTGSIIPPEGFQALRSTNVVPTIPGHASRRDQYAVDHRGTFRERALHENHAVPIPDLLSQKANESNFQILATRAHPIYVQNPSGYPYTQNPYPQITPLLPDHFRQQSTTYLSSEYNNRHQVSGSLNTPHDFYVNANYQNHFNFGIQPRDVHSMYAARQYHDVPYENQMYANQYVSETSHDRPVYDTTRGMNSPQLATYQSNTYPSNWANRPIAKRDVTDNDIDVTFF